MNKELFTEKLKQELALHLVPEEYEICSEVFHKMNGLKRIGILARRKGDNVCPTIYVEPFFDDYCRKKVTLSEIATTISDVVVQAQHHAKKYQTVSMDFESNQDKIIFRLISKELNETLLEQIPYIPFLNMAVTFLLVCDITEDGIESFQVTNQLLEHWDKSVEDLAKLATVNTPKLMPAKIDYLEKIVTEYLGIPLKNEDILHNIMLVSNQMGVNGATVWLYKDFIQTIAERFESNLYIIPSSMHEILVVPEKGDLTLEELNRMVEHVNSTQIKREDLLSDRAYYYEKDTGEYFY